MIERKNATIQVLYKSILLVLLVVAVLKSLQILAVVSLFMLMLSYERLQAFLFKMLEKFENSSEGSFFGNSWKAISPEEAARDVCEDPSFLRAVMNAQGKKASNATEKKEQVVRIYMEYKRKLFSLLTAENGLFPNQKIIEQSFELRVQGERLVIEGSIPLPAGKNFNIAIKLTANLNEIIKTAKLLWEAKLKTEEKLAAIQLPFGKEFSFNYIIICLQKEEIPDEILGISILKFDSKTEKFVNIDKIRASIERSGCSR